MKNFITGFIIASILFFLGYLFDFDPLAFYILSLFSAGIIVYGFPVFKSEDLEWLKAELSLSKNTIDTLSNEVERKNEMINALVSDYQTICGHYEALRQEATAKYFNPEHLEELKASYSKEAEI